MSGTDEKGADTPGYRGGPTQMVAEGDFGPVTMLLDRSIAGVLKVRLTGIGGDAEAALRRWRHNFAYARDAGLTKILIVLELSGPVIPEPALAILVRKVAEMHLAEFRVAVVQTRHERQNQDELGILLAMEYGLTARVFPDEASALLWLRYGAS